MTNKPRIGLTYLGKGILRMYMKSKYTDSLRRAGAIPVWLPWTSDSAKLAEYCAELDGFVFPGGADVNPMLYGEEKTPLCEKLCPERDEMEMPLLKLALEKEKPILCICRGLQLLNVALGGTLYQDINTMPEVKAENHVDFKHRGTYTHSVELARASALYKITSMEKMNVNSIHHQAINALAPRLSVAAKSPAGIIEAAELADYPFCIGTQWHPEHLSATRADQQEIFNALVCACQKTDKEKS
ncbi:MAG: gamma-glutamyl-gamma-aminobutyrate hydrolase family protein [Oscillospiraceae bacterium]